jgi:glycosyltransferase 2 family protein
MMDNRPSPGAEGPDSQSHRSAGDLLDRLRRRLLFGLGFGVLVIVALVILSDGPALWRTLRDFQWWLFPVVLLLTTLNYAGRYLKWEFYIQLLKVVGLRRKTSFLIFMAGLTMSITPGKVGEVLKAYLVRRATGTPMAVTAPIPIGERLTDGIAMLLLASFGLLTFRYGWPLLLLASLGALSVVVIAQNRRLVEWIIARASRFQIVERRANVLRQLHESIYILLQNRNLVIATAIGTASWACECFAFYVILIGLGMPANLEFLILAFFVLASATVLGSVSMLPGGLGAAEATVAGLLLVLVADPRMTTDVAGAATLLVRFATLWFGVILGVFALLSIERHLQSLSDTAPPRPSQSPAP